MPYNQVVKFDEQTIATHYIVELTDFSTFSQTPTNKLFLPVVIWSPEQTYT